MQKDQIWSKLVNMHKWGETNCYKNKDNKILATVKMVIIRPMKKYGLSKILLFKVPQIVHAGIYLNYLIVVCNSNSPNKDMYC